jgi:hypothetical protein
MVKTEAQIHKTLMDIFGMKVDLMSLRRTGLSRLASAGTPLDIVLSISRHRSIDMLEKYLAGGIFHGRRHEEMCKAFESAWKHDLPMRL